MISQKRGPSVASTSCFVYSDNVTIPPDGTLSFEVGPSDDYASGAITVTAIPTGGELIAPPFAFYLEVVQIATRRQQHYETGDVTFWLDVVVRNNSHENADASIITSFDVYVSVVKP
jgi:hypothetical protein